MVDVASFRSDFTDRNHAIDSIGFDNKLQSMARAIAVITLTWGTIM